MKLPIILTLAASVFAGGAHATEPANSLDLVNLLKQDCGSCHGLTLRGGLGPALTPEALKGTPDDVLVATILYGRPQNAMPPWSDILTRQEVEWIVDRLREGL
ncbi:MAG: cytochrome c [Pseudomonadales bacterium]